MHSVIPACYNMLLDGPWHESLPMTPSIYLSWDPRLAVLQVIIS